MTAAGAALQIQDHNAGFLHVLQKQQLNRDYLQTERIETVEQRRLGTLSDGSCGRFRARLTLWASVSPRGRVRLVTHVFRAVLGMGNCRSCPEQRALRGRWRDILIILPLHPEQYSAGLQGAFARCCSVCCSSPCGWPSPKLPAAHQGYRRDRP